jgi:hypothetical protein
MVIHEHENSMYGVMSSVLAELVVLMLAVPGYIPAIAIGYFMIGFPLQGFPFMIAFVFVATFSAEVSATFRAWSRNLCTTKLTPATLNRLLQVWWPTSPETMHPKRS